MREHSNLEAELLVKIRATRSTYLYKVLSKNLMHINLQK